MDQTLPSSHQPSEKPAPPEHIQRFETSSGARIYRICCEVIPHYQGFVHLALGDFPSTLFDTGSGDSASRRDLYEGLELVSSRYGESFQVENLQRIWLTHTHHDHIGATAELVAKSGARVGVHPYDSRLVVVWDENAHLTRRVTTSIISEAGVEPSRQRELVEAFAMRPHMIGSAPRVDEFLRDGDQMGPFTIYHVPGHSPGHLLFELDGWVIGGDHLLSRTVSQLWPERMQPFTGVAHALASINRLLTLPRMQTMLTGHEEVITNIPERTRAVLETHHRRNRRLLQMVQHADHPVTASELSDRIYTHRNGFFGFLAVTDVVARLEYLMLQGLIGVANSEEISQNAAAGISTATHYYPLPVTMIPNTEI
ncbi:MAG: MBL fold metallo-hydrolase [Thermoguttaceae bacterium]|nr:MBL fold metallo-hydrolase [Thermoguttaceae bacterium]